MALKIEQNELAIEFDGPEVTPDNLDARAALELATAYLDLLTAIAKEAGQEIRFTGLQVKDKCAAITTETSAPKLTRQAATEAMKTIRAPETAPSKVVERAKRVRRALTHLPEKLTTRVFVGRWKRLLELREPPDLGPSPRSVLAVRAEVVRVGGETPHVRFESGSESRAFSLTVTKDVAKRLAPHLYSEVDIVALITRDADGHIEGGMLEEFHVVDEGNAVEAWRDWHRENATEWHSVKDVEAELGRDRP